MVEYSLVSGDTTQVSGLLRFAFGYGILFEGRPGYLKSHTFNSICCLSKPSGILWINDIHVNGPLHGPSILFYQVATMSHPGN